MRVWKDGAWENTSRNLLPVVAPVFPLAHLNEVKDVLNGFSWCNTILLNLQSHTKLGLHTELGWWLGMHGLMLAK